MRRVLLPAGFNVEWMLHHIRTSSFGLPYRFVGDRVLRRPLRIAGVPMIAEFDLSQAGIMQLRLLQGRAATTDKKKRISAELVTQTKFVWGLDDDAERLDPTIASDLIMAPLVKRFGVLRIVRAPDLYEALLIAIIGQQVSVFAAQSIRRRLMQNLGTRVVVRNSQIENYYLYPTGQQLIEAGERGLRGQGLSRQKSAYLMELAYRDTAGELERDAFADLSDGEAIRGLCQLKGVGRWTAEIVLMRGLGRTDVFPAGDLGLQVAFQEARGMRERPSEEKLRKIAERWAGWRSYAAFYLWMILQSRAL